MIDKHPAVIVRCKGNSDVIQSIRFAREHNLPVTVRGRGGNFGVVNSFEFQLHPIGPEVWVAEVLYPVSQAKKLLQEFRSYQKNWPAELSGIAVLWSAPMKEPIPEEFRGAPIIVLVACYSGDVEKGEEAIRPLREIGIPLADFSGRVPFVEAQQIFDPEYPNGRRYYWKAINIDHLEDPDNIFRNTMNIMLAS